MSPSVIIEDIAITGAASSPEDHGSDNLSATLDADERTQMVNRLLIFICGDLMVTAAKNVHEGRARLDMPTPDPNYITRISTNEFYFYTQEPLTLHEFEYLQNKIAQGAAILPNGIQLILSSFAVKTSQNAVMNVTAHVTCGSPPQFHFIVKNNTSPVDVRYKEFNDEAKPVLLPVFDVTSPKSPSILPDSIQINGVEHQFSFHNIIVSTTPGGTPFLTAVDICYDHSLQLAKRNIDALISYNPFLVNTPISHVLVSNTVVLQEPACIGHVMHVDPIASPEHCKADVVQQSELKLSQDMRSAYPVNGRITTVSPCPCESIQEIDARTKLQGAEAQDPVTPAISIIPYLDKLQTCYSQTDLVSDKLDILRTVLEVTKEIQDCFATLNQFEIQSREVSDPHFAKVCEDVRQALLNIGNHGDLKQVQELIMNIQTQIIDPVFSEIQQRIIFGQKKYCSTQICNSLQAVLNAIPVMDRRDYFNRYPEVQKQIDSFLRQLDDCQQKYQKGLVLIEELADKKHNLSAEEKGRFINDKTKDLEYCLDLEELNTFLEETENELEVVTQLSSKETTIKFKEKISRLTSDSDEDTNESTPEL